MGMISRGLKGIDSLINYMTAMGTSKDASSGFNNKYTLNLLDRATLNTIYRGDWIGKRVVKAPAQDSTRAWRNWQAEQKQIELLEEVEKKFDLQRKLKAALIAARLYGGAGLVIGVNDSVGPEQELNIEKVGKDGLTFVHVMTRYDLKAEPPIDDIMSPWYGEPEFYTVSTTPKTSGGTPLQAMQKIHPSRVIRLIGEDLPDAEKTGMGDNWRGDSVLQAVDDVIRATGLVNTGIAGLIHDAKMDIIKIKGFSRMLAEDSSGEYKNSLMARLTVMNNSKSMFNSVAMDAEEEWERTQTNFAALPDLMQKYLSLAAGAADIPMSRLLGQSSSGLGSNAGSENDTRNYYDRISSEQKTVLSPALTVLDEIVIRSALGKDDKSIWYEWAPLWQMTELELATIAKSKADTTAVYVNTGLINEDALRIGVANQLNEDATYPGLDTAIEDEGLEPPAPTGGFDPQTGTPLDPQTGLPVHPAVVKALAAAQNPPNPKKPTHAAVAADALIFDTGGGNPFHKPTGSPEGTGGEFTSGFTSAINQDKYPHTPPHYEAQPSAVIQGENPKNWKLRYHPGDLDAAIRSAARVAQRDNVDAYVLDVQGRYLVDYPGSNNKSFNGSVSIAWLNRARGFAVTPKLRVYSFRFKDKPS